MADEVSNIIAGHVSEIAPDTDGATDSGVDSASPVSESGTETTAPETNADKAPNDPPDELLAGEFKGNKYNRLPYSRVKSIVENAKKKAAEEHAAALAEHQTKLKEYETASQTWQREQNELRQMAANPEQFLRALAVANPAYAEIIERAFAKQEQRQQPQQQHIEPDVVLPDGSFGYSAAAAERVYEQRMKAAEQQMLEKLSKRFEPIESEFRARKAYEEMIPRVRQQLTEASKWPLFSENQDAIRTAMEGDRSLSLEAAYRAVVLPKLQSDRDKMRQEILAEINGKAKAAATPAAVPAAAAPASKDQSVESIIRAAIRKVG